MIERRSEANRAEILRRTKNEIAERLRYVCEQFDPQEFDALLSRIAEVHIKYTMRRPWAGMPMGDAAV